MSIGGDFSGGGNSQLMSTLALLADPVRFQAKLAQLKQAEDNANAAMARLALGEDIAKAKTEAEAKLVEADKIRNQAQIDANQAAVTANQRLANAEAEATRIIEEAKAQAFEMQAQAQQAMREAREMRDSASEELNKALTKTVELEAREAALREMAEDQQRFSKALEAEKAELNQTRKELDRVFTNLRS